MYARMIAVSISTLTQTTIEFACARWDEEIFGHLFNAFLLSTDVHHLFATSSTHSKLFIQNVQVVVLPH